MPEDATIRPFKVGFPETEHTVDVQGHRDPPNTYRRAVSNTL